MKAKAKLTPGDKALIRFILGRVHVGTSDADVVKDLWDRIDRALQKPHAPPVTSGWVRAALQYAVDEHHRNREFYGYVMGGGRR